HDEGGSDQDPALGPAAPPTPNRQRRQVQPAAARAAAERPRVVEGGRRRRGRDGGGGGRRRLDARHGWRFVRAVFVEQAHYAPPGRSRPGPTTNRPAGGAG